MLRWSGSHLADASAVSLSTIRRVEGSTGIPEGQNIKSLLAIKLALESAGIEFIGTPQDGPGVRLRN